MQYDEIETVTCSTTTTTSTTSTTSTTTTTTGTTTTATTTSTGTTTTGTTTTSSAPLPFGSKMFAIGQSFFTAFDGASFLVTPTNVTLTADNQYVNNIDANHAGNTLAHDKTRSDLLHLYRLRVNISLSNRVEFVNIGDVDGDPLTGAGSISFRSVLASGGGNYISGVNGTINCMACHPTTGQIIAFFFEAGVLISYILNRTTGQLSGRFDWSGEPLSSTSSKAAGSVFRKCVVMSRLCHLLH